MAYSVYKHTAPNGKVYIGITSKKPVRRWNGGTGYLTNDYFTKAINKYGWNSFAHEVLFVGLTKEEAEEKEIELIKNYKSDLRKYGYNIQHGGNSVGKHSEETKNKIAQANKGRKPWDYKVGHSEDTKRKMSKSHMGMVLSENAKKKISIALTGRKQTKESIEKRVKHFRKRVICIETNAVFESLKDAAKYANVRYQSVSACVNGITATSGGYHWEYYKDTIQVI